MVTQTQPTDTAQAEKAEAAGWGVPIATRKSPVQEGVELVQRMVQGGEADQALVNRLHELMSRFAFAEIRSEYEGHLRETARGYVLTIEEVTDESNEHTPMAEAYWAATSLFFRKVYQAAAAAA